MKENVKPIIFIVIVLVLTAISAYPQRKLYGKVAEIVDGKTVMVEMPNGRLKVALQYIEVPEPEQPLYQTVKDHLQNLVLGKTVEVLPGGSSVGQVYLGGVNISQQMLRDGAAWFNAAESGLQNDAEKQLFLTTQDQARAEKRGVWGIEGLKPAWEFRADKAKAEREKKEALLNEQKQSQLPQRKPAVSAEERARQANASVEIWADIPETTTPVANGKKTGSTEELIDEDDKDAINAESRDSLLKNAELSSAIAKDFALTYKNSKSVYDYSKLAGFIDSIEKGVGELRGNFKNLKNLAKIKEIQQITQDARAILKLMDNKNAAVYKGDLVKISTRYEVKSSVIKGEEVIEKQVILRSMFKLMKSDFDYLKMNITTVKKV